MLNVAKNAASTWTIRAQATIMGYADSFALIGVMLLVAVLAVTMLRKGAAAGGAAH
jgi:DHA2 family multidrug resistance protein